MYALGYNPAYVWFEARVELRDLYRHVEKAVIHGPHLRDDLDMILRATASTVPCHAVDV
jgi:hypothetical protein